MSDPKQDELARMTVNDRQVGVVPLEDRLRQVYRLYRSIGQPITVAPVTSCGTGGRPEPHLSLRTTREPGTMVLAAGVYEGGK